VPPTKDGPDITNYLHLATSETWCWSGGRGILTLYYNTAYQYNGAQWYQQLL